MKELTVYQRMISSAAELVKIVSNELGVKCCQPFAIRAFDALNDLGIKTESEAKRASNVFLDNLQTLFQGGITSDDYDKLDLVKRGKVITVSARIQALIRAFRRKGYMLIDTVVAVPKEDDVYFEENYKDNVGIIYLLKDQRKNTDREITAERLVGDYFDKFICRLEIRKIKTNESIMTITEMSKKEVLFAQSASENGIFLSEWKDVINKNGDIVYKDQTKTQPKKYKVIHDGTKGEVKYNFESMWYKWTSEMVKKTVIRRALKNIKEAIPELAQTIRAFDTEYINEPGEESNEPIITIDGINNIDVDLKHLTEEQNKDVEDCYAIYCQNPASAKVDAEKIKDIYESGTPLNEIINEFYAELTNIAKSKNLYPLIKNILQGVVYEKNTD